MLYKVGQDFLNTDYISVAYYKQKHTNIIFIPFKNKIKILKKNLKKIKMQLPANATLIDLIRLVNEFSFSLAAA